MKKRIDGEWICSLLTTHTMAAIITFIVWLLNQDTCVLHVWLVVVACYSIQARADYESDKAKNLTKGESK